LFILEKENIQVLLLFFDGFFFIFSFVCRQILGIKDENDSIVDDPCTNEFYDYFRETARKNGEIYETVFNTLPTNKIRSFAQIEDYVYRPKLAKTDPIAVNQQKKPLIRLFHF